MNTLQKLENMKEKASGLQLAVLEDILDVGDNNDIECYIKDVMQYGCISGSVSMLIYYEDTAKFYNEYELEILEKIEENEISINEIAKKGKLSNALAWLGYELTLSDIAQSVGIE